jgi:signal transduction histidine kinase
MFSKLLSLMKQKTNLRLAALYSAVFLLSSLVLFSLTYLFLYSALVREDHRVMQLKLREFSAIYRFGGIQQIEREVSAERLLGEMRLAFIRIADQWDTTIYLLAPEAWRYLPREKLREVFDLPEGEVIRLQVYGMQRAIESASLRMENSQILQVGIDVTERITVLRRFREIFLLIMIPFAAISFIGGSLLAARALRPVHSLTAAVHSILDTGRFESRVPQRGKRSELDELVILFNRMLEKIQTLINGMKDALDRVAHDLKTPLTRFRGTAETALNTGDLKTLRASVLTGIEESEHILTMLDTLMDISEAETGVLKLEKEHVDLSDIIQEMGELYRYVAEEKNVSIQVHADSGLTVWGDVNRLRQVVANLLDNAVKYTPPSGEVKVNAGMEDSTAVMAVRDTGEGIPENEIPHIWDRLYQGLQGRKSSGLGLGLSLVRAVVQAHGGRVEVSSSPGSGSVFKVYVPATS